MRILGYDIGVVEALIIVNVLIFIFTFLDVTAIYRPDGSQECIRNKNPYLCYGTYGEKCCVYTWHEYNLALAGSTIFEKPWTILTSMFLHSGFHHLLFNMIALFFFGIYLGSIVGEKEFLRIYFIGGIAGGLLFTFTSLAVGIPNPYTFAVGASGAIFAVGGALTILRPRMMVILFPIPFPMPLYMAVFGFMVLMSFLPGIAWQGHLGGLIVGALYGYRFKKKESLRGHFYGSYEYRY